jgi:hypothetical protein
LRRMKIATRQQPLTPWRSRKPTQSVLGWERRSPG